MSSLEANYDKSSLEKVETNKYTEMQSLKVNCMDPTVILGGGRLQILSQGWYQSAALLQLHNKTDLS